MQEGQTHFGYESVDVDEKVSRVREVFRSVAPKYDLMNDLMSVGVHRLWKRYTLMASRVKTGDRVLDLAGGTGDLTRAFAKRIGASGHVVLADINEAMLAVGRAKLEGAGVFNVDYVQANAEALPFETHYFDCITIAFGLRNVTDKDAALRSMYRILKPGGRLLVLEFSKPAYPLLSKLYDQYSFRILPRLGQWFAKDAASYQYLAESIRMHPDQETLKNMMATAGFERCRYTNLSAGIVALHEGCKI
ncbi:ubiquinone biosynthesis methyltransferase UbiE [Piscirickettsia salmonis]|uniref:Ubiquinone/menaquinone biosynthesis C-methyltransferase UbiE n=1 Tax=Piscirickettsia salmonis TaxID=1238 RepID=A0A9Q6LUI7_PISSA|nr:bifunctional demethylmenaquinone methyltransferase/2-methoxy-6-polyprenyl-1,4-benzoquinol methylase UbiE [Piscirickettsia salmonis]RNC79007.1 bifunctional demethylmenaquinone methyltransferase/2-methoxy-6-polyprenyl-1,4-benzoquinol methylase UbiE [Piscirickettsiaceae bacterium NZ-RLO2]ALA23847.1 ubiquinone/menaquinone biosynthesis methyltransferase ubiE [Piscirickettsia salmonis]APS44269.1 ubiquinone biosynthesis methyltransferase UbiE [Piscirickettsia salmonis]APS47629.1 ubiquinone biosynth